MIYRLTFSISLAGWLAVTNLAAAQETLRRYLSGTGKVVRMVFEGVMVRTEVFLNGQPAGPAHEGSFYEFKYDLTPRLKFGATNLLEVTVSKVAKDPSVRRAGREGDFWNFGGIFRPVFLEAPPSRCIDWTGIDAQANGNFKADVHLGPGVTPPAQVRAQLLDSKNQPVGEAFSTALAVGQEPVRVQSHFDGVKLRTAETPNSYRAQFTLLQEGVPQHTLTNQFGFRTIELRTNDGFYLNGVKIVMKGVNRHSLWADSGRTLSPALAYADARLVKDMNMNAVRMSHYPPDRAFLDACDELGIYALDELTGWGGHYDTEIGQKLVGEMVRRAVNHPSVLVWDNGNEGGWNNDLDDEFAKWDSQPRIVMHPRSRDRGINDPHYPDYASLLNQSGGPADLLGVNFDFPEAAMNGITWLGCGPYHVWQNRLQDPRLDVWQNACPHLTPSATCSFDPDCKGYFRDWCWAAFDTRDGKFTVSTAATESYLGIYKPSDGPVGPLLALPGAGLAFLEVIAAMRTKFLTPERMGPQSALREVSGRHTGEVTFEFGMQ